MCGLPSLLFALAGAAASHHNPCRTTAVWVTAPRFSVDVSLSELAKPELLSDRESIKVVAYFFGMAKSTALRCGDSVGEIHLGKASRELQHGGAVVFSRSRYDGSKVQFLEGGAVRVLINVFSGRKASQYNVLACDPYEGNLLDKATKSIAVHCKLIIESSPQESPRATPEPGLHNPSLHRTRFARR